MSELALEDGETYLTRDGNHKITVSLKSGFRMTGSDLFFEGTVESLSYLYHSNGSIYRGLADDGVHDWDLVKRLSSPPPELPTLA